MNRKITQAVENRLILYLFASDNLQLLTPFRTACAERSNLPQLHKAECLCLPMPDVLRECKEVPIPHGRQVTCSENTTSSATRDEAPIEPD